MQPLAVVPGCLAGLAGPGPLALAVGEARPGEHVVIGQVQVGRVHRKLADELEQACQAVQQPLGGRRGDGILFAKECVFVCVCAHLCNPARNPDSARDKSLP